MNYMNKSYLLIFLFCGSFLFSQTTIFGGISDLAFRKTTVKENILPTDTLQNRLMNFHFVKDTVSDNYFNKLSTSLNQSSIFIVSNKFGGADNKLYCKIGSSIVSSQGIIDFTDTLSVQSSVAGHKILTFSKNDNYRKINPIVLINKKTDPLLMIPEILVFSQELSPASKQKIETYLSLKFGITINDISEKNYLSSQNSVIWDSKKNKNFNFRITGLGRDDSFELYQKQSKNWEDNNLMMSLGEAKITNSENISTLQPNTFILWGDNNQSLTFKEADLLSAHPKRDMVRLWKAQVTSSQTNPTKSNVYLTHSGLTQNESIKLRIFSNESNYENDLSNNVNGERLNDSLFIFRNVNWDTDHSKTDYFTFTLDDGQSELQIKLLSTCTDLINGVMKISVPDHIVPFQYSIENMTSGQLAVNSSQGLSNLIEINNLPSAKYKLRIQKQGYPEIIRMFDLEGISNQNIDDHYIWSGTAIELDLNTDYYQYVLTSPSGNTTQSAPFQMNGVGNYQLKIKNKLGCEITKTIAVLNQADYQTLQSNSLFKKITVSPNPSHDGNLTVHVELKASRPMHIKIFNAMGVLVKQGQYNSASDFTIPMTIPAVVGYYNIKIFIPEEGKGVNFLIN